MVCLSRSLQGALKGLGFLGGFWGLRVKGFRGRALCEVSRLKAWGTFFVFGGFRAWSFGQISQSLGLLSGV